MVAPTVDVERLTQIIYVAELVEIFLVMVIQTIHGNHSVSIRSADDFRTTVEVHEVSGRVE